MIQSSFTEGPPPCLKLSAQSTQGPDQVISLSAVSLPSSFLLALSPFLFLSLLVGGPDQALSFRAKVHRNHDNLQLIDLLGAGKKAVHFKALNIRITLSSNPQCAAFSEPPVGAEPMAVSPSSSEPPQGWQSAQANRLALQQRKAASLASQPGSRFVFTQRPLFSPRRVTTQKDKLPMHQS